MSRNREAYVLKVATLGIALATSVAITLFSVNEFGYDRFHKSPHEIFRVVQKNLDENYSGNRLTSKIDEAFVNTLTKRYKDSLVISRVKIMERVNIIANGRLVSDQKLHAVDTTINGIFSFNILAGRIPSSASHPTTGVIVSSAFAERYWGKTTITGEKVKLYTFDDTVLVSIAAVFKSFPENSHEKFDVLISFDNTAITRLNFNPHETGVYGRVLSKLPDQFKFSNRQKTTNLLQPLPQIYFGSRILGEAANHGDRYSVIILICITSLIFFLAVTTFVNLTTITLPYRAKELAVKKLAGITQESLILGFIRESCSLVGLSLIVGLTILLAAEPLIDSLLGFSMVRMILDINLTFILIVTALFTLLTISPIIMTFRFVEATPNRLLSTDTITFPTLKRYITFIQLGISIFLIIASVVVKRQINYSLVKEPGQNHDQIVFLNSPAGITNEGVNNLRNGWRKYNPNILDVMAVSQLPDRVSSKEINSNFYQLSVDPGYRNFFNLAMIDGNWFDANAGDSSIVINKAAQEKRTELNEPVLGVITDVNSLFNQPEKPTKIKRGNDYGYNWLCVRVLEVDIRRTVERLSNDFSMGSEKAEVRYLSENFETWINYQDRLNKLSGILAIIAGILSCCTIYALSISVVRDKLKQIALHRLFGATTLNISLLLIVDFLRQLGIALLLFLPASYLILNELLRTFIYSTKFSWLDPLYPLAYCIIVIGVVCLFQAWNLKRTNSIAALKG